MLPWQYTIYNMYIGMQIQRCHVPRIKHSWFILLVLSYLLNLKTYLHFRTVISYWTVLVELITTFSTKVSLATYGVHGVSCAHTTLCTSCAYPSTLGYSGCQVSDIICCRLLRQLRGIRRPLFSFLSVICIVLYFQIVFYQSNYVIIQMVMYSMTPRFGSVFVSVFVGFSIKSKYYVFNRKRICDLLRLSACLVMRQAPSRQVRF